MARFVLDLDRKSTEDAWELFDWAQGMMEMEIMFSSAVQRENVVKEEIERLETNPLLSDEKQRPTLYEELARLEREFWSLERTLAVVAADCPSEPAKDAYLALRKRNRWHLTSQWLREDCVQRGGCCGRSCRCCEQRMESHRGYGRGHCTAQCGCCSRLRGAELTDAQREEMRPAFDLRDWSLSDYSVEMVISYIWSLN